MVHRKGMLSAMIHGVQGGFPLNLFCGAPDASAGSLSGLPKGDNVCAFCLFALF